MAQTPLERGMLLLFPSRIIPQARRFPVVRRPPTPRRSACVCASHLHRHVLGRRCAHGGQGEGAVPPIVATALVVAPQGVADAVDADTRGSPGCRGRRGQGRDGAEVAGSVGQPTVPGVRHEHHGAPDALHDGRGLLGAHQRRLHFRHQRVLGGQGTYGAQVDRSVSPGDCVLCDTNKAKPCFICEEANPGQSQSTFDGIDARSRTLVPGRPGGLGRAGHRLSWSGTPGGAEAR